MQQALGLPSHVRDEQVPITPPPISATLCHPGVGAGADGRQLLQGSHGQRSEFETVFQSMDVDNDRRVTENEFLKFLR